MLKDLPLNTLSHPPHFLPVLLTIVSYLKIRLGGLTSFVVDFLTSFVPSFNKTIL